MIKSSLDFENDLYGLLRDYLPTAIEGCTLYKKGCRPLDSCSTDAVVNVSTADAGQIQAGRVHLNVYVPDIDNDSGTLVPDKARLTVIAGLGDEIVDYLNLCTTNEYLFHLYQAPQEYEEPDIRQHFVDFPIEFERITF